MRKTHLNFSKFQVSSDDDHIRTKDENTKLNFRDCSADSFPQSNNTIYQRILSNNQKSCLYIFKVKSSKHRLFVMKLVTFRVPPEKFAM